MRHRIVDEDLREIVERVGPPLGALAGRSLVLTGATGLIGAYLAETVAWLNESHLASPCRLTAIARRAPAVGSPLEHLRQTPGFRWVEADARQVPPQVDEADFLVLAATAGAPRGYLADPIGTLELNGSGLGRWLDFAARARVRAVLYFSSGEVYGSPVAPHVPTPESHAGAVDPTLPRNVYAEAKRYGEALALAYARTRGVPARVVRPFQVFGPGVSPDGRAIPDFVTAAAAGEAVRLRSAGDAVRTFLYLADATVAFWQVLLQAPPGSVYNVGRSEPEMTVRAAAERVAQLAGVSLEAAAAPEISGAPERSVPDVSRLASDFGFSPRHDFDDLVTRSLQWLRGRSGEAA